MTDHDSSYDAQKLLNDFNAVKRISPDFNELSMDMQEVLKESNNPAFLAALLYKLTKEREETNKLLANIEKKFARIEELLINRTPINPNTITQPKILSEPDQFIMHLVDDLKMVSAQDVKLRLAYRNTNAASQRLNKLTREGHLVSVRQGRKVLFMRPTPTPNA
ncbi:MAG: hypothetical protein ACOX1V_04100 [Candidatus Iainarchaeum sp.]|jgi:hypothetical protein|nr:MAG: hypothetical protein BWY55_00961 [archaeon ADurb.Bin336]